MKIYKLILIAAIACAGCNQKQAPLVDNSAAAWYKNELIYNLDVKTFLDSDGDGLGDFKGLQSKLGYLDSLGVTTIWLAPFQPSPWMDDGYDVTDYCKVDPRLGTIADFKQFVNAAKGRKMRVIMDLVLNHTSTSHPWFRQRRGWYLWSAKRPSDWDKGMGFPAVEKETWRYDSTFKAYYFHRFYHFQPDLNFQNKAVVAEAKQIMRYWLNMGLDGFRLDAVPFIIDDPRKSAEEPSHDFKLFDELTHFVGKTKPGALLLGEANVKPEEAGDYFAGNHKGLDMMLNFDVNQYMFYALATGDAEPFCEALETTANKPPTDQWAHFLRNHDEIDLGKLSKKQMSAVNEAMGPDTSMQLYERGIRRRLAPMLNNNRQRLLQAYSLLFALPGTPIMRYGEEIGMGDDLQLKERMSVRTPMQWNNSINAGFSTGTHPFRPVISSGIYGYKKVNVHNQMADSTSLWSFICKVAAIRKAHPEVGQGKWQIGDSGDKHVLLLTYKGVTGTLLMRYNFSNKRITLKTELPVFENAVELISGRKGMPKTAAPYEGSWYWLPDNK